MVIVGALALSALDSAAYADASPFTHDMGEFLANPEACDHFRGADIDPPDAQLKEKRNEYIATYCRGAVGSRLV